LNYISQVFELCGFKVNHPTRIQSFGLDLTRIFQAEREVLRIPSTKNVALIGKPLVPAMNQEVLNTNRADLLKQAGFAIFKPRTNEKPNSTKVSPKPS